MTFQEYFIFCTSSQFSDSPGTFASKISNSCQWLPRCSLSSFYSSLYASSSRSIGKKPAATKNLPPGSFGWPIVGETLAPEEFVRERIEKYGSPLVFKTSVAGESMAVFCEPQGNQLLFDGTNGSGK